MTADTRGVVLLLLSCSLSILVATNSTKSAGRAQAARSEALALGDRRQHDMDGGQRVVHDISLTAGQFLHAVVEPHGIDVAVSLTAPDGRELRVVDLSDDHVVPETIMTIAATTGRYQIAVTPALAGPGAGRYVIHIKALREATSQDVIRAGVMRTFEAGMRLRNSTSPEPWGQAVTPLRDAINGFHELGDLDAEARALIEAAGNANNLLAPETRELAERALAANRARGDATGIARAAGVLGVFHTRSGEVSEALRLLTESVLLSEKAGSTQEAIGLNNLGTLYGSTGQAEQAQETFRRALSRSRRLHLPRTESFALGNLGVASKNLGDYRLALSYYEQALPMMRSTGNIATEATVLNNLGNLYRLLGEPGRALAMHEDALALARRVGSPENEARALSTLGSTQYRLGEFANALDLHHQALGIRQRIGDLSGQGASHDGAGQAWHRLGHRERALDELREALRIRRSLAERQLESDTLVHLALVERDGGNLSAALDHLEAAMQLTEAMRGQVVSPDSRATFVAAAHERFELYIDVLMLLHRQQRSAGFAARALEASEGGRARVLLESLLESKTDIRQGIDPALLERERALRRQLDSASTRLSRLLSRQSDAGDLAAARASLGSLSDEHRQLQVRIRRESPAYTALTQPEPLTTIAIQREVVDADTVLLEYALGETHSWLWAVTPTGINSFELPPRGHIEPLARRAYELLTARQLHRDESASSRVRRVAQADEEWRSLAAVLGHILLGQAATHFGGEWRGKRLLVVAADSLQYIPFSALPDPATNGQPLVVDHEVVTLASASLLALIRQQTQGRPQPAKRLAVLADPVFATDDPRLSSATPTHADTTLQPPVDPDALAGTAVARALRGVNALTEARVPQLSRLPFSRHEANAISALVPANQRLSATDFDASRAMATSGELGGYRMVHFATHGFLNSEQPELSGLVLSLVDREGQAQDGFLRLSDIYNMRLPADLIVLSACQTALGTAIRGEGLVGLTRGFMYAGARRVVASLWQVDDLATTELMTRFYRRMIAEGRPAAAALRLAQLDLLQRRQWSSPFFWAAFTIQGDWR